MIVLTKKPRQARVSFYWILHLHNESRAVYSIQISGDEKSFGIASTFRPAEVRGTTYLCGTWSLWRLRHTNPASPVISLLSTPTCWPQTQTWASGRSLTSSSPAPQDQGVQVRLSGSICLGQCLSLHQHSEGVSKFFKIAEGYQPTSLSHAKVCEPLTSTLISILGTIRGGLI